MCIVQLFYIETYGDAGTSECISLKEKEEQMLESQHQKLAPATYNAENAIERYKSNPETSLLPFLSFF